MTRSSILLVGTALVALGSPAFASDLLVTADPAPAPAQAHDWDGAYAGISAGLSSGVFDWSGVYDDFPAVATGDFDMDGWTAGAQAGVNFQHDSLVFGLEGDVNWTNFSGWGLVEEGEDGPDDPTVGLDLNWTASLRGRAGVAFDAALLYTTAGIAFGGGDLTITDLDGGGQRPGDRTASTSLYGWTVGAGAEFAVTDTISIRGEYAYTSLTSDDVEFIDVEPHDGDLSVDATAGFHTVKTGLNFAF